MEVKVSYVVDTLLHVSSDTAKSRQCEELVPIADAKDPKDKGEMIVVPVVVDRIQKISSVRIFIPKDLKPLDNRKAVTKSISVRCFIKKTIGELFNHWHFQFQEVQKRFGSKVPLLDPVKDMKINEKSFKELMKKIGAFEERLKNHELHADKRLSNLLNQFSSKNELIKEADAARAEVKKAKSLLQMTDLKCMKSVLRRLDYCTAADVIQVKGRIACELSSADELLLTEMVFNGLFNNLTPAQAASILSCFVCDEKSNEMPKLTEELSGPLRYVTLMNDFSLLLTNAFSYAQTNARNGQEDSQGLG